MNTHNKRLRASMAPARPADIYTGLTLEDRDTLDTATYEIHGCEQLLAALRSSDENTSEAALAVIEDIIREANTRIFAVLKLADVREGRGIEPADRLAAEARGVQLPPSTSPRDRGQREKSGTKGGAR